MAVKLLHNLFNISLALSPVIMLLLFASPLLGKRYGARLRCLVWLALAVRLLIPLNTPIKIAVALPQYEAWMTAPEFPQATDKKETDTLQPENLKPANASPVPFTAVWAAGAGLFLLYQAGAYMYTCRRLRRWSAEVTDENTLRRFEKAKAELSVTGSVGLFLSPSTASPLLAGFLRPRVVLPDKPLENVQLDFMLRHELTHLKRGDLWYKLLLLLANAVHWFNPLVWLLASQLSFDTELACDADVLAGSGRDERKAYGYTVLSFIEYGWRKDHDLLCLTPLTSKFLGGKKQLKKRFYNITDTTAKKRGLVFLFAIMLIAALAGSSVYAAAQVNPTQPESYIFPFFDPGHTEKQIRNRTDHFNKMVNNGLALICKELNIPAYKLGGARHSQATWLADAMGDEDLIESIAKRMAHNNKTVTQIHYIKLTKNKKMRIKAVLDALVENNTYFTEDNFLHRI